jgi:ABC-type multidrug transport system fused ATPase/permease subunit
MYMPLNFLGTMWRIIRQNMVDVENVFSLLEVDEIIRDPEVPLAMVEPQASTIEFRNITFTYDKKLPEEEKRTIIDNVSFTIPAGKSTAIVGTTGSGKSTIMRLLYRFYELDEGEILIDG